MDLIASTVSLFLHLDSHLADVIAQYGLWTYLILFVIIFCETGLVVTPFLPGDSLLFAAGTFAAAGALDVRILLFLLAIAAILGDTSNYAIGGYVGPKIFRQHRRWLNHEHLERTKKFYDRYGAKTIVLARFLPIIRTFAPFVAGIGHMKYETFAFYNVAGGIIWVLLFLLLGYGFGNIPIVRDHFSVVILAIIVLSFVPGVIEYFRKKRPA
ncbi:DedA family protein [Candidatus Uhrbacteria bacterium]|nr:DedA family protein [Candidatus Uhrbacteria bacterium]